MKCLVCKFNEFDEGTTTLTIERGDVLLVVTEIPARVCVNCGEPYIAENVAQEVEALANEKLQGEHSLRRDGAERTLMHACF